MADRRRRCVHAGVFMTLFAQLNDPPPLIVLGVLFTLSANLMSLRVPQLPGGAVPDPHPRPRGRLRLFLEPAVGGLRRPGAFIGPGWLPEHMVRSTRQGRRR